MNVELPPCHLEHFVVPPAPLQPLTCPDVCALPLVDSAQEWNPAVRGLSWLASVTEHGVLRSGYVAAPALLHPRPETLAPLRRPDIVYSLTDDRRAVVATLWLL